MFRKTLSPTDFSLHANKVLERIPNLKAFGIEEVILVHNINPMKAARWTSIDEAAIEKIKKKPKKE